MRKPTNTKRKRFTKAEKIEILSKFEAGRLTCSELAGQYRISPVLIYKWRKNMRKTEANESLDYKEILAELEAKTREIEHLQKALGDSIIKIQILEKTNDILKKNIRLKKLNWQKK